MNIAKDQIMIVADPNYFPAKAFEMASVLSKVHEKGVTFLYVPTGKEKDMHEVENGMEEWCSLYAEEMTQPLGYHILEEDFTDFMENNEVRSVIFELIPNSMYPNCKKPLKLCRELRIAYYFLKPNQVINYKKVLVPVGFLVEEKEKGVFCSGMGRLLHSEILLMTAKDYGSRAKENAAGIRTILDKFKIRYSDIPAQKDSFKIELEAVKKAKELQAGLLLISASRDYGLDDIIFGPKEQKVIEKSEIPVMVINPRKDLYALCE